MSLTVDGNRGITNASWTVGTRPGSPTAGQMGYNTDIGQMEFYDGSNWRSLSSPGPIGAVTASTGAFTTLSATTPAQFDADTSVATTAFVQRALGSYSSYVNYATNTVLTAANVGQIISIGSTAQITLPAASSVAVGSTITFVYSGGSPTIVTQGADGLWGAAAAILSQPLSVKAETLTITSLDSSRWSVMSSTWIYPQSVESSLAGSGYQKLPSGLIMQWAYMGLISGTSGVTSFPIAFPNGCFSMSATPSAYAAFTGVCTVVPISTSQFNWYSTTGFTSGTNSFYWTAIGY